MQTDFHLTHLRSLSICISRYSHVFCTHLDLIIASFRQDDQVSLLTSRKVFHLNHTLVVGRIVNVVQKYFSTYGELLSRFHNSHIHLLAAHFSFFAELNIVVRIISCSSCRRSSRLVSSKRRVRRYLGVEEAHVRSCTIWTCTSCRHNQSRSVVSHFSISSFCIVLRVSRCCVSRINLLCGRSGYSKCTNCWKWF